MVWLELVIDLFLLLFVLAILLFFSTPRSSFLDLNLYRFRLTSNEGVPAYEGIEVVSIDFPFIVALLFIWMVISVIFDMIRLNTQIDQESIKVENNYLRWVELAFGLSIMLFIISVISGVKEFDTVFLLLVINIVVMFQLNSVELFQRKSQTETKSSSSSTIHTSSVSDQSSSTKSPQSDAINELTNRQDLPDINRYGWFVSSLVQWLLISVILYVILKDLLVQSSDLHRFGRETPTWIYIVVVAGLLLYTMFSVIQSVQLYYNGNYMYYDTAYRLTYILLKIVVVIGVLVGISTI